MEDIKIGLIVAPDMPEKLTYKCIDALQQQLKNSLPDIKFDFDIEGDSVTGSAEYVHECIDYAYRRKNENNWDFSVCVTDLPSFSNSKAVLSDVSTTNQTALISLPSLGIYRLKHKFVNALSEIIYYLYSISNNASAELKFSNLSISNIKQVDPNDHNSTDERFVLNSTIIGGIKAVLGMTYANQPWKAIGAFKKIISLGFATGTYVAIFSTPWQLSIYFSILRFIILMFIAVIGMVSWLIYSHHFWEKPSSKSQRKYRYAYNLTTFTTLISLTVFNYIILFLFLFISVMLFVPDNLFQLWGKADGEHSITNYLRLTWFITSVGLLAGALGSVLEGDEKMKELTYSSRQYARSQKIDEQLEKEEASSNYKEREEQHAGQVQSHKEGSKQ